jgi:hypothetical protein
VKDQTTAEPCPLCDGTKVDPGGLPSCRACSVVSASLPPDNAAMVSSLVAENERMRDALDQLRAVICAVGIVGQIDGYEVIRRNSVIDLIDRSRAARKALK